MPSRLAASWTHAHSAERSSWRRAPARPVSNVCLLRRAGLVSAFGRRRQVTFRPVVGVDGATESETAKFYQFYATKEETTWPTRRLSRVCRL